MPDGRSSSAHRSLAALAALAALAGLHRVNFAGATMIFKGVRTAAILLASLTSRSACSDEAAEDALNKLESPLTAIRAELAQVQATLPAVGVEHEMACDPRLAATVKLYTLDERRLNAITGTRAIAETKAVLDQAHALSSSALEIPTVEGIAKLRTSTAMGAQAEFLGKRAAVAQAARQLIVVRTSAFDPGLLSTDTYEAILKPASWKGWVFVVDLAPPRLRAALPVAAQTSSNIEAIVQKGQRAAMFRGNLETNEHDAIVRSIEADCGATAVFSSESPY